MSHWVKLLLERREFAAILAAVGLGSGGRIWDLVGSGAALPPEGSRRDRKGVEESPHAE
jgi:hypothetical protein